jgi:uncharacterized membrane protein
MKLNKLGALETALFSVGLSIAFLMFGGLLINEFGSLVGISNPLSPTPLILVLNSLVITGGIVVCFRNGDIKLGEVKISPFMVLLVALPILSIVGSIAANVFGNNFILLLMLVLVSLLFAIIVLLTKFLNPKLLPFALFMIAVALVFHTSLATSYMSSFGSDVPGEYLAFKTAIDSNHWNSANPFLSGLRLGRINAMLSVTILPTVYSNLLNMDPILIFRLLFPLLFSFVPLGLYALWRKNIGGKYAFISVFLIMAQQTFYIELLGLNRQMIAELFFILLLLVVFSREIEPIKKNICFMIFSFALVTSHYGLSIIFFLFIVSTFIYLFSMKQHNIRLPATMVFFFFTVMFVWYMYTSRSAVFDSIMWFGEHVFNQLSDFFDPASRGTTVLMGVGMAPPPTMWNSFSRVFAYVSQFLIVLGFVGLFLGRAKFRFEKEAFVFTFISMVLLAALLLVPGLANTLNMTRFYHILLFFLAPLCVLGAEFSTRLLSRRNKEFLVYLLVVVVIVPYFLFQTGFVYEIAKSDSWSLPLSKYRMSPFRLYQDLGYVDGYGAFGAHWFSQNVPTRAIALGLPNTKIYTDVNSQMTVLKIYGLVHPDFVEILSNVTEVAPDGVVFLSSLSVIGETVLGTRRAWNFSELGFLQDLNKIYSNGGSEVYKNLP